MYSTWKERSVTYQRTNQPGYGMDLYREKRHSEPKQKAKFMVNKSPFEIYGLN